MTDQNKIILMTKLALYEKKYIKEDRRRNSYYIEDYIYLNNFKSRLSVSIVFVIFIILGGLKRLTGDFIFPTSLEQFLKVYINPYVLPWIVLLIVYSFITTYIYARRYNKSQKRYSEYRELMKQLNAYDEEHINGEES